MPIALASTSCRPATTGVPSARPVASAAAAVIRPAVSVHATTGGSLSRYAEKSSSARTSSEYSWVWTSHQPALASVGSVLTSPVRRCLMTSLQGSSQRVASTTSGSCSISHARIGCGAAGKNGWPASSRLRFVRPSASQRSTTRWARLSSETMPGRVGRPCASSR